MSDMIYKMDFEKGLRQTQMIFSLRNLENEGFLQTMRMGP